MAANYNASGFIAETTSSYVLAAGTSSTRVQYQSANNWRHCRVVNTSATNAFVEFGQSTVAATVPSGTTPGSICIAGNTQQIIANAQPYVAAITSSGTTTLYVTAVEGGLS